MKAKKYGDTFFSFHIGKKKFSLIRGNKYSYVTGALSAILGIALVNSIQFATGFHSKIFYYVFGVAFILVLQHKLEPFIQKMFNRKTPKTMTAEPKDI